MNDPAAAAGNDKFISMSLNYTYPQTYNTNGTTIENSERTIRYGKFLKRTSIYVNHDTLTADFIILYNGFLSLHDGFNLDEFRIDFSNGKAFDIGTPTAINMYTSYSKQTGRSKDIERCVIKEEMNADIYIDSLPGKLTKYECSGSYALSGLYAAGGNGNRELIYSNYLNIIIPDYFFKGRQYFANLIPDGPHGSKPHLSSLNVSITFVDESGHELIRTPKALAQ